jgi:peptide/nickel transport system substrate-binding protein
MLLPVSGSAQDNKSITIALIADPTHLDPRAGEELSSNIMYYHLYDPLVKRNADLSFGPSLATSWDVFDDTTWVFSLRENVTFHNGNPFTAADVVFTVQRAK